VAEADQELQAVQRDVQGVGAKVQGGAQEMSSEKEKTPLKIK